MKRNTENAIIYIKKAFNELDSDFNNARNYLSIALNEIQKVQTMQARKVKREFDNKKVESMRLEEAKARLKKLDDMYKEEALKLQNGLDPS